MTYISETLRRLVVDRAQECCEYCLIYESDSLYGHEIDHIIPEKHRGQTNEHNLCLSCIDCNRFKGSDFASFDPETGEEIVRLFNPRRDIWTHHFRLEGAFIVPVTAVGRVTVFVLKLNDELRVRSRRALITAGRYPPTHVAL